MAKKEMTDEERAIYYNALQRASENPPKPDDTGSERDAFYDGLAGVNEPITDYALKAFWRIGNQLRSPGLRMDADDNADWLRKERGSGGAAADAPNGAPGKDYRMAPPMKLKVGARVACSLDYAYTTEDGKTGPPPIIGVVLEIRGMYVKMQDTNGDCLWTMKESLTPL